MSKAATFNSPALKKKKKFKNTVLKSRVTLPDLSVL